MKHTVRSTLALALLALATAAAGQNVNPDISVIGDVRAWVTDNPDDPKDGDLQLDVEGFELALQGYLNPFARADAYVAYHDGSFELEEAYATILRGLPGGLQVKAGKYRVDFGKLNQLHPHAYSFLDTPLAHQQYLGAEGLIDIGVNVNWQVPVGSTALTFSGNVLKGDFAEPHEHSDDLHANLGTSHPVWPVRTSSGAQDEETANTEAETDIGYSERVSIYVPTGDYAGVEIGINALQGTLDRATGRDVSLLGADAKYRWAPDRYRSVTLQAEWMRSERDVHADQATDVLQAVNAKGWYAFADWRFRQRWNVGAIVERADLAQEPGQSISRVGAFGGFQVMEETTILRLLLRRSDGDEIEEPVNEAILQLVFSLGPHKAHWF